ncbi:MAG: alanine--glyoxylate aminotransferase family protein [Chlamydiae bacterium]|nr:alanine--glyoxylate aminotransferase family protein [Chlamydiota bacterium]MBI3265774.1 alanine--glyoxylate aminotransferase family protein [Chlamydiota bacterium]
MKKEYLFAPGPTPVPPQALEAMARPILHHRTGKFREIFKEISESLKEVFQTSNQVLIFGSSGTGAMEASIVNVLGPGDQALVINGGKFGERFLDLCKAYGIEIVEVPVKWGTAVNAQAVQQRLAQPGHKIKAVYATLCETSTGVVHDIEALGRVVAETNAILVVDAISGLAADQLRTDAWQVDIAIGASQKALMVPPGLAFASLSPKAWKTVEANPRKVFYFSFQLARKALEASESPFTPPVSLLMALRETLKMIREEGIDKVVARHADLARRTREGVRALGLELYAPDVSSNAVTAVKIPQGIDGSLFVKRLREGYGVTVAGGQGSLKGKIFRIAHLGYCNTFDVLTALSSVEGALNDLGFSCEPGKALQAALQTFETTH